MGNSAASDEEVIDIARKCGCYDFISNLENGFETRVGTGGNHLSGGERQRIAIARAMLKNAPANQFTRQRLIPILKMKLSFSLV